MALLSNKKVEAMKLEEHCKLKPIFEDRYEKGTTQRELRIPKDSLK